jgi:hypothetical protein
MPEGNQAENVQLAFREIIRWTEGLGCDTRVESRVQIALPNRGPEHRLHQFGVSGLLEHIADRAVGECRARVRGASIPIAINPRAMARARLESSA